jgi:PAS domain S-box-containing protein
MGRKPRGSAVSGRTRRGTPGRGEKDHRIRELEARAAKLVEPSEAVPGPAATKEELLERLERLQRLIATTRDFIWEMDSHGRYTYCSPQMEQLWGLRPEQMIGKSPFDLVPPEHREAAVAGFAEQVRSGEPFFGLEVPSLDGHGRPILVEVNGAPFFDADGNLVGFSGATRDITELRLVLNALRESEQQLRSLFENLLDAYAFCQLVYDEAGRPVDFVFRVVNAAFTRLTGVKDVAGKRASEAIPGLFESVPTTLESCHRVATSGRPERFERYVEPLRMWLVVSMYSPSKDHFVVVFDDITARKNAEAERERLVEALREVDCHRTDFLAMLSHELRNPLAPIRNSLYILERVPPGSEQARRAQAVIARQTTHLTHLVDELLDMTRITRGKIELKRESLDFNELAQRTVEDHRNVFVAGGIDLEVKAAPTALWVDGDQTRLAQAVGNLLHNAAKFTPRGGSAVVTVEVDVAGAQATLTVRDTGAGIAPEMMPRLFEAFAQAEPTLDRSKGGLGLGLALVKHLVEMHGGSVGAASDGVGRGATFTLRLPLEATRPGCGEEEPGTHRGGVARRILVIEDNLDAGDSLREMLELGGHIVEVAADGPAGMERARALRPEVVLCDIGLPGMDGYAVARAMRADPELHEATLVALTGYAGTEDVAKAKEAGFHAHLAKPATMEQLEQVLADAGVNRR